MRRTTFHIRILSRAPLAGSLWALLTLWLLSVSFQPKPQAQSQSHSQAQPQSQSQPHPENQPPLPAPLAEQCRILQARDDLSGWIYSQIQWVAKDPVSRAGILARTVGTAWRRPRTNEEIQAWQFLLINEGYSWLMSGDIVRSTDSYTTALQWARQNSDLTDETLVMDNILKPLGNNYTRLGDYEQALYIQGRALVIARTLKDRGALAGVYSNLANTASNMGQPARALEYCRHGLETVKGTSALRGLLLSEEADALKQLGHESAARTSIRLSISILESAAADPAAGYWLLIAYQQAGDIFSADPAQSLRFYNRALTLQTALAKGHGLLRQREKAKLFQRLGNLYTRRGDTAQATYWLDQCLAVLIPHKTAESLQTRDLFAENTLLDCLFTRALLAGGKGRTDEALRLYRLSFAAEKELHRAFITGSSKEQSISDSHGRYEIAIHTAWDAWERTGNPKYRQTILDFMESSKAQLLLEEVLQQQESRLTALTNDSTGNRIRLLERALIYYKKEAVRQTAGTDSLTLALNEQQRQVAWELAELRKKYRHSAAAAIPTPDPAGAAASNSALPDLSSPDPSTSGLSSHTIFPDNLSYARSYFTGSNALYTIESGRNGIRYASRQTLPEGWQDSIRSFIHEWFADGVRNMLNRPEDYYRQAYGIAHLLFGDHPLEKGKKYILLPDGALNGLPVDALVTDPLYSPNPANWPFVIRIAGCSYAWSLRTLQEQLAPPGTGRGISGFFLPGDIRRLPLLRAIANEEQGIAAIVKEGKWYKDQEGTTGAFRKALQGSAILHISSHAFSDKDSTTQPRIELANEPFYIFELKELQRQPSLVILSACRTGDGRMVTGEGTQSLARAFTANGTHAVVAGWWNVNDETAAQLMLGFYRSLFSGHTGPATTSGPEDSSPPSNTGAPPDAAECLRRSKLDWLKDPQITYQQKLPYYWAALNYTGNPAPLPTQAFTHSPAPGIPAWLWWTIPLLVIVVVVFFARRSRRSRRSVR